MHASASCGSPLISTVTWKSPTRARRDSFLDRTNVRRVVRVEAEDVFADCLALCSEEQQLRRVTHSFARSSSTVNTNCT